MTEMKKRVHSRKAIEEQKNPAGPTQTNSKPAGSSRSALILELTRIRDGISRHSTDTVWCGEAETAWDALTLLIDDLEKDGPEPRNSKRLQTRLRMGIEMNRVLFSSMRLDWRTPKALYDELNKEFNFDCDPCLVTEGTIHDRDMLGSTWGGANFVNPPYGRELPKWIKKGYEEHLKGKLVVFLIPSRTDTVWWHEYIMKADEIRFIRGRLKFGDSQNSAPFPSAIIVFKPKKSETGGSRSRMAARCPSPPPAPKKPWIGL